MRVLTAPILSVLLFLPTALGYLAGAGQQPPILHLGWGPVVPQSSPNTCGPAVIATLARLSGQVLTEQQVAEVADLSATGVSLAEFSRLAGNFGFVGKWLGARMTVAPAQLPTPSVVHLSDRYGHFAILHEVVGEFVRLLDPARGDVLLPAADFRETWSGRIFVFESMLGSSGSR